MEREYKRTGVVYGYFDVVDFDTKEIKAQGEAIKIKLDFDFDKLPECFRTYAREYTNKKGERKAEVRMSVSKADWYNAKAEKVVAPPYETLTGRYKFDIVYYEDEFNGNKFLRVSSLQFKPVRENPFTAWAEEEVKESKPTYEDLAKTVTPAPVQSAPMGTTDESDLPF